MKCSIIIVTYNAKEYTEICLKKLLELPLDHDIELVLLDNYSSDGVTEFVKTFVDKKNVKVILSEKNLGFALGNNEAIKSAVGNYIFLLNPDTEISITEIRKLINYLDLHDNVGVVGPKIYDAKGLVQESYGASTTIISEIFGKIFGSVYLMNLPFVRKIRMNYYNKHEITSVGWIGGAALMIRKKLFNEIGGIDSHFFYSALDMVDLCAVVKSLGFEVIFYPNSIMTHKGGASNVKNKVDALRKSFEGSLYYFKKHKNIQSYYLIKTIYIIISTLKGVIASILAVFMGKTFYSIAKSHFINAFWMLSGKI